MSQTEALISQDKPLSSHIWFVLELLFYQLSTYSCLVQGRLASSEALSSPVGAAEESSCQLLPLRQGMHLRAVSETSPTS